MNSVSRGSARLSVQVVTLNKHCVVTEASYPYVSLTLTLKLNPLANVKPGRGKRRAGNKENRERIRVIIAPCGIFTFHNSHLKKNKTNKYIGYMCKVQKHDKYIFQYQFHITVALNVFSHACCPYCIHVQS